jgi:TIR domain
VGKRYDVFLSCKNLGRDGKPTRDSVLAEEIYQHLSARKLSVFFSKFELEAQGVSAYTEVIDAALDASQVLIAIGTSREHLESKWVRYEWNGFFNDIISGIKPDGKVFSYIDGILFNSLPRALRQCQAVAHGDASLDQLYRFVANALNIGTEAEISRESENDPVHDVATQSDKNLRKPRGIPSEKSTQRAETSKAMAQEPLSPEPAAELWKDMIWDRLLESLDDRTVIPIVGPDLVQVEIDGSPTTLHQYLALQLAQNYKLQEDNLPAERALNYVACQLARLGKDHYEICDDILQIMKKVDFRPSKALQQLAEITDLNLFVSTTFDPLLVKAIDEVRFGGAQGTLSIAYSPKRVEDLPSSKKKLTRPAVFHLMGKLSASGAYAISDEERLAQVLDLQSPARSPQLLCDELRKNHLLILGEDYSNSPLHMFLRTAKGGRFSRSATDGIFEILADNKTNRDPGLVSFLSNFSSHTRLFPGGPVEFVDDLWTRWRERHPDSPKLADVDGSRDLPRNAVFISYTDEDLAAVQEIKAGLESAGLPVRLAHQTLRPGELFKPVVADFISRSCGCFVAVLSKNTERRTEGFFRAEWNMALERDRGVHFSRQFIVPVVVDDTTDPRAVPPRFSQLNYTWLPGGKVTPAFVQNLKEIVSSS